MQNSIYYFKLSSLLLIAAITYSLAACSPKEVAKQTSKEITQGIIEGTTEGLFEATETITGEMLEGIKGDSIAQTKPMYKTVENIGKIGDKVLEKGLKDSHTAVRKAGEAFRNTIYGAPRKSTLPIGEVEEIEDAF